MFDCFNIPLTPSKQNLFALPEKRFCVVCKKDKPTTEFHYGSTGVRKVCAKCKKRKNYKN